MAKCGKGCMPECQYFTTGGCISPFNCPYKIETGYINSATSVIGAHTQGSEDLNEPKIKKWFRRLVEEGKIQQEPANYDAATLKIYIDHLEKENTELCERLSKAVELPKLGDKVCRFYRRQESGEIWILEGKVIKVEMNKYGTLIYISTLPNFYLAKSMIGNLENEYIDLEAYYFCPKKAAEARLAELKGEK